MRRFFRLFLTLAVAGCAHPVPQTAPSNTAPRAIAVYRAVAESIYVSSTKRVVAVASTSLDSACTSVTCTDLAARWGVETLWWARGDSTEARDARADLLARAAPPFDVRAITLGQAMLLEADAGDVPSEGRQRRRVDPLSRGARRCCWRSAHVAGGIQPVRTHGGDIRRLALRSVLRPHRRRRADCDERLQLGHRRDAAGIVARKVRQASNQFSDESRQTSIVGPTPRPPRRGVVSR